MLRAFIAIKLSDELKRQISELQAELRQRAPDLRGVSWVQPEGIHLTLRFLGDIEESQIKSLQEVLQAAACSVGPFSLVARGLGAFPTAERVRVLWIGLSGTSGEQAGADTGTEALHTLQAATEAGVVKVGFPREERAFTPHLTLARVREAGAAGPLAALVLAERERLIGKFTAGSLALIKSELRPKGAIYTSLVEVPFGLRV